MLAVIVAYIKHVVAYNTSLMDLFFTMFFIVSFWHLDTQHFDYLTNDKYICRLWIRKQDGGKRRVILMSNSYFGFIIMFVIGQFISVF